MVEGKGDVTFVNHTAEQLRNAGYIPNTFEEKRFAVIPIGGCGNLKHWATRKYAEQFNLPWCILIDSDHGTRNEVERSESIQDLRRQGLKAYATRKREPENYIHCNCLQLQPDTVTYSETDDAKAIIGGATQTSKDKVLEVFWPLMTAEQIREVEQYNDGGITRYVFTEMFIDFLSLV